jgi:hypothetical protein
VTLPIPDLTTTSSYLFRPRVLNPYIVPQNWVFMILFNPLHSERFWRFQKNCEKWVLPSLWVGRIFVKFDIWIFFENLSIKLKFH